MTNQTSITTYDQTKDLLKSDEVKNRFKEVLGDMTTANKFIASVLSAVLQSPQLSLCTPQSIFIASMKSATMQLSIDLGQSYLVPYGKVATFLIGYKGIIQLALRTKQYLIINATTIYEGEQIIQNRLTGAITLNGKKTSETVIGYCAYFKMKSGYEHFIYMTMEQLIDYAKRYSPSYKINNSLWHTDFDSMAKKTVLKQLLSHYGELSVNIRDFEDEWHGEETEPEELIEAEAVETEVKEEEEKKPRGRKKKEEVIEVEQETPFVTPEQSTSDATSTMPSKSEPPPPPSFEEETSEVGSSNYPQILVNAGYFREVGLAKAAMMWYSGPMNTEPLFKWAAKVKENIQKGMPLAGAAREASK